MSTSTTTIKLPGTPKPWMNSAVMALLRTPGLRSVMGKMFLILTVTGAKTGNRYITPVQYVRDGNRLLVLSQRTRRWWRNLEERPDVEIVLRGETIRTMAHLTADNEEREVIATTLRLNPRAAKFYGVAIGEDGEPATDCIDQLQEAFVAIVIDHARRKPARTGAPGKITHRDETDVMTAADIYRSDQARCAVYESYDRLAAQWPVPCEDLDVETEYGNVHVLTAGPIDGTPVMLLHAASMGAPSWGPNAGPLVDAGFRLFAIDHIGEAGRSVLRDPKRYPSNDDQVANLYHQVADRLGIERGAVVGASAGAQRAIRYALAFPERVSHLGLIGPMGLTPLGVQAIFKMMTASMRPTPRRITSTTRWALGTAPAVTAGYGDWFEVVLRSVASPPRVARPTATPADVLRTITIPTLVALGDHDNLVGPADRARTRATAIPDAEVHVLASAHLVNVECAPTLNPMLVQFLRRTPT
jgi:deazaflavin-dependent oxidoreductase (nitroreductase family)